MSFGQDLYLLVAQELEMLCCQCSPPSHGQLRAFVVMSLCKPWVQAMQENEAMTRQAVTWVMLRGPKHRLRTKGSDSRIAA